MPYRAIIAVGFCSFTFCLFLVDSQIRSEEPVQVQDDDVQEEKANVEIEPLTVEEARRQAVLLQNTYEATLHVMHRRYFDADEKDVIPARALEDIFDLVDEETGGTTGWIAVNTPAMNVDHEPKTEFEVQAVEVLNQGERVHEAVIDGTYHRAGAVTLFGSCLKCHLSALTKQVQKERVAALVVRLPVQAE